MCGARDPLSSGRCQIEDGEGERTKGIFGLEAFRYDGQKDEYRCPAGQILRRYRSKSAQESGYAESRISGGLCGQCEWKTQCTRSKAGRRLKRPLDYAAVQKGREQSRSEAARRDRKRRKHLMEGSFADAANRHHFKRARWRGLAKQPIQDYLIAICQNLRILASKGSYLVVGELAGESGLRFSRALGPMEAGWMAFCAGLKKMRRLAKHALAKTSHLPIPQAALPLPDPF